MDYFTQLIQYTQINVHTALFRLILSFIAGTIIGLEREKHRQPAGLRTHLLISIGSTLLMLISIYIPQIYTDFQNGDPSRIAAQVVTGVGFIGAGAILRMGINVRGLTTAASIWAISAIGLALGAGLYLPAALTVVFMLIILIVVEQLERFFFNPLHIKLLTVVSKSKQTHQIIIDLLHKNHYRIIDVNPNFRSDFTYEYIFKITAPDKKQWIELLEEILSADNNIIESKFHDPLN